MPRQPEQLARSRPRGWAISAMLRTYALLSGEAGWTERVVTAFPPPAPYRPCGAVLNAGPARGSTGMPSMTCVGSSGNRIATLSPRPRYVCCAPSGGARNTHRSLVPIAQLSARSVSLPVWILHLYHTASSSG